MLGFELPALLPTTYAHVDVRIHGMWDIVYVEELLQWNLGLIKGRVFALQRYQDFYLKETSLFRVSTMRTFML